MSADPDREAASSAGAELKNIFGLLEKKFPQAGGGRAVPEELRQRMEKFANGQIPAAEIEPLCAQILGSPEAIRALARILGED